MKIATWNVNSLRARLTHLEAWIKTQAPDVLCLQETKVRDVDFPTSAFAAWGYHVVFSGQPSYNGVAIASRMPLTDVEYGFPQWVDEQRRVVSATCAGVRVASVYVPNGTALDSPRYAYKLGWLAACTQAVSQWSHQYPHLVLAGDFNIAPADRDVYDPAVFAGGVLVSAAERQAFQAILACGLVDAYRLCDAVSPGFSWWDYRAGAFRQDHGVRIDHILLSPALCHADVRCVVDRTPRGQERPSDHTPVVVDIPMSTRA